MSISAVPPPPLNLLESNGWKDLFHERGPQDNDTSINSMSKFANNEIRYFKIKTMVCW